MSKVIAHDHHHIRVYTRPLFVTYGVVAPQTYISRAVSAVVGSLVTSPFYVVQTLAQVGSKEGRKSYTQIFEDLYHKEGISAFFKGSLVNAVRIGATASLNYLIYWGLKKLLKDDNGIISFENHQIANIASIILSTFITYPLESIRTRLILDWENKKYNGALDCLTNTISNTGWGSLFNGAIISSVAQCAMVEVMERIWAPIRIGLNIIPPSLVDACVQSVVVSALYYPIDTVLKILQAPPNYRKLHSDVEVTNFVDAATNTVSKHGISGLYRGFGIASLGIIPYLTVVGFTNDAYSRVFTEVIVVPHPHAQVVTKVEKIH